MSNPITQRDLFAAGAERPGAAPVAVPVAAPVRRVRPLSVTLVAVLALTLLGGAAVAAWCLFGPRSEPRASAPVPPPSDRTGQERPKDGAGDVGLQEVVVTLAPETKRKEIGKAVYLETEGEKRRVIVDAVVCLREGQYQLEGLLTRKGTKEHEYVLSTEADGIRIHAALLAAGAEAGSPVTFQPKYVPASGSVIKVSLRYEKEGKTVSVPAQAWVRNRKTKKDLDQDWVFAGSRLIKDPEMKQPPFYLANQGDYICVANMDGAMLDIPVPSASNPEDRIYEPNTERIPALGTRVEVVYEVKGK